MVPEFEEVMIAGEIDELSQPFETEFGFHIVQVLERRLHDDTVMVKRQKARDAIRRQKLMNEKRVGFVEYVTRLMLSTALNCSKNHPIAITPGDPAGVGPDVLLDYAKNNETTEIIAYADPELLKTRAKLLGYPIRIEEIPDPKNFQHQKRHIIGAPN